MKISEESGGVPSHSFDPSSTCCPKSRSPYIAYFLGGHSYEVEIDLKTGEVYNSVGKWGRQSELEKIGWQFMIAATDRQVGGEHYKKQAIQPIDYIMANNLPFCEGNVVKYVTRHRDKGGRKDIEKAIQYLEFILENEYD